MNVKLKRIAAVMMVFALLVTSATLLKPNFEAAYANSVDGVWRGKAPKYVFLFIGDGMTYPQFTSAAAYLGAVKYEGKAVSDDKLGFMKFPVSGTATTFDSTSFCPDSASTATSIATGFKTLSGTVNMNEQKTLDYETISEKLKTQKGYKIGVVSSVPINHATPAAFYAHEPSRGNYYEIGLDLINSQFNYFAGGEFIARTGKKNDQKDLHTLAEASGYKVVNEKSDILSLGRNDDQVIAISPVLSGEAMPYEIDRKPGELSLADFTRKGIDVLFNDTGFFMMVEGGKIDWACHANDAVSSIHDTIAFDNAVAEAVKFYNKYPNDTLIVVTGDHETGGMTLGFAGTKYSTYLDNLQNQTLSYEAFNKTVEGYRKNKTPFETVLKDVYNNFGLMTSTHSKAEATPDMVLSDYEYEKLKAAYTLSMVTKEERSFGENTYLMYGSYEPLTIAITDLLNNKSGIGWTSYSHTGLPAAVFAKGVGAELFSGSYDNTDIFMKLTSLSKTQ